MNKLENKLFKRLSNKSTFIILKFISEGNKTFLELITELKFILKPATIDYARTKLIQDKLLVRSERVKQNNKKAYRYTINSEIDSLLKSILNNLRK